MGPTKTVGRRSLVAMTAALLAGVAALSWLDLRSETAAALREGRPVLGLVTLETPPYPPQLYLLIFGPADGSLNIVYIPPHPASADAWRKTLPRGRLQAARALAEAGGRVLADPTGRPLPRPRFYAHWEAPAGAAYPPEAFRSWVASWRRDARFWPAAWRAIGALARQGRGAPPAYDAVLLALEAYRLRPGTTRLSWLPRPREGVQLLARLLSPGRTPAEPASGPPVTVEVLNASGRPGLALRATKVLRWRELDVLEFGNASADEAQTRFIDRYGRPEQAERAAEALGCPQAPIVTQMDLRARSAVTAVLGRDWRSCAGLADAGRDKE